MFLLNTCKWSPTDIWGDDWLNGVVPLSERCMPILAARVARLSARSARSRRSCIRRLDRLHDAMPPSKEDPHRVPGWSFVSWNALRRLKNQAAADGRKRIQIGSRLWILAAVRGTRHYEIRQKPTDILKYAGCSAALQRMDDVLMPNTVGIADDLLLEYRTDEDVYLKRTFDKYRGTFASLQCAWDDEHLDAIQTLALHFEGSFGHAMQQVKQKLCADPSAED